MGAGGTVIPTAPAGFNRDLVPSMKTSLLPLRYLLTFKVVLVVCVLRAGVCPRGGGEGARWGGVDSNKTCRMILDKNTEWVGVYGTMRKMSA